MLAFRHRHFWQGCSGIMSLMVPASHKKSMKTLAVFTLQVTTYWQPSPWPETAEWFPHMTLSSLLTPSLPTADSLPKSPGDMLTSRPRCLGSRWCSVENIDTQTHAHSAAKKKPCTIRNVHCHEMQAGDGWTWTSAPLCSCSETTLEIWVHVFGPNTRFCCFKIGLCLINK